MNNPFKKYGHIKTRLDEFLARDKEWRLQQDFIAVTWGSSRVKIRPLGYSYEISHKMILNKRCTPHLKISLKMADKYIKETPQSEINKEIDSCKNDACDGLTLKKYFELF
jgi:hypothetical protein